MSKTCAQRKKERDRNRQRDYVGTILMDNRTLYKEMTLCGFPVTVSLSEATSGTSQKWEEEKQAYLNCEKVSLAEAINYFGSDVILDLTSSIVRQPSAEDLFDDTIVVQQSSGDIQTSRVELVGDTVLVENHCTNHEVPHSSLNSHSKRVMISPIAAEDVTDIPSHGDDTIMVVDEEGYLGSFLDRADTLKIPIEKHGCSDVCKIPIEVLNVMVMNDHKLAQRCQIIRRTVDCNHLDGLQIVERPDAPIYTRQTLSMGKVPNERGFRYFDHFGKIPPKKCSELSDTTWHYLHTLRNRGVAARALGNVLRYTESPGRRTKILYNWNSGAPKHELFPVRFSS